RTPRWPRWCAWRGPVGAWHHAAKPPRARWAWSTMQARVGPGGRAHVRAILYMSTLVAVRYNHVLKRFYERLRTAGKVAKVALTACMPKLFAIVNALVKHQKPRHCHAWPS